MKAEVMKDEVMKAEAFRLPHSAFRILHFHSKGR